jgi:hypothetical protein
MTCCLCLATRHCLFSTSPPGCLSFAGWLSCCILSRYLHLMSPLIAPPPHVSILNPPPSFALAGCCIASCRTASTSCPLINLPLDTPLPNIVPVTPPPVCPDWLPCCLLWHLCLTSASSPSPPPPPLVMSCFHPPRLLVVLSPINLRLCNCHPPLSLLHMVVVASSTRSIISHHCCMASPHVASGW